jgi:hypothetical protein
MPVLQNGACFIVDDGTDKMVSGKLASHQLMYCKCVTNGRGCVAVAVTGLGMSTLDTALLIMCIAHSLSWLLVMGQAWGGHT